MNFDASMLGAALREPRFVLFFLVVLGVVLVNGWTDAPNAITAVVCSGVLSYRRAVLLAAVMNVLGLTVFCRLGFSVGNVMSSFVAFEGETALTVIEASLASVLLFAVAAWFFGIPTSESHALCAALGGAASLYGADAVNRRELSLVLVGAVFSCILSFLIGFLADRALGRRLEGKGSLAARLQILGTAAEAFFHGAQDGQKFLGIFFAGVMALYGSRGGPIPTYLILLFCGVMAAGTLLGGRRIVKTVGEDMVSVDGRVGVCGDIGSSVSLLTGTVLGIPVSSTHVKACAIMGAGFSSGAKGRDGKGARLKMACAWILTFPACFLLARCLCRLMGG